MSYIQLTKPRSISLLLVAALAGLIMAQPSLPAGRIVAITLLAGALAAGGANALNCYLDRDLDRRMARTAGRPLPSSQVSSAGALVFGLLLCLSALVLFAVGVNLPSAILAGTGILYYVVVYTIWLKTRTWWNVVIGGGAGALPLLVGWAASSGQLSPWALWMGAIVVLWTPPHFWSLALLRRSEYASAGVPMLPVVRGEDATRVQILFYSVAVVLLSLLPAPVSFAGLLYLLPALALGGGLVWLAARLWREGSDRAAQRVYGYSVFYLALLFLAMILDHLVH